MSGVSVISTPSGLQRIVDRIEDHGRRGDRAALAHALDAELGIGRRRLHVEDADGRDLGRPGQQIVGEGRGERLAVCIERALLVERGADALRDAAQRLALDHHRVDQRAAILDDDIVEDLDLADAGSTATTAACEA